jgi:hypothetical protein
MAFTVVADGHYHIVIILIKEGKAGDALTYYYGGLKDEKKYNKIPSVSPPDYKISEKAIL